MAYSLSYDDFNENMTEGMHDLLHTGHLADVTLAIDGKIFKAHKTVLALYSPYFRELFMSNPHPHPLFFMHGVKHHTMRDLLAFMYLGQVQIEGADLGDFVATATSLQVKGLNGSKPDPPPPSEAPRTLPSSATTFIPRASTNSEVEFVKVDGSNISGISVNPTIASRTTHDSTDPLSSSTVNTTVGSRRSSRNQETAGQKRVYYGEEEPARKHKHSDSAAVVPRAEIISVESGVVVNSFATGFDIKNSIVLPDETEDNDKDMSNLKFTAGEEYDDGAANLQFMRAPQPEQPQEDKCSNFIYKPVEAVEYRNEVGMLRAVFINKHRYNYHSTSRKKTLYVCCQRQKSCSAAVCIYPDNSFEFRGVHKHPRHIERNTKFDQAVATYYCRSKPIAGNQIH